VVHPPGPAENVFVNGSTGFIALGDGHAANPTITADGFHHFIALTDDKNILRLKLDGANGVVVLLNDKGKERVVLDAGIGYGAFGGHNWDGGLGIFPADATNPRDGSQATIFMNGKTASVNVGPSIFLDGNAASVLIGGASKGSESKNGSITLIDQNGHDSIQIDAATGDIALLNADCAEDFDLAEDEDGQIELGSVMVFDENGRIRRSSEPYDSRVAGVLSGAGGLRPGLVLDRRTAKNRRLPVALMGKVFCKADAQYGGIRAGDLLTTSPTPGHAMKMTDRRRALGSVLGKALGPIGAGQSLIPILVTLQ
jgi:hypothetical protein